MGKSGNIRCFHDTTTVSTILSIVDISTGNTLEKRTVTEKPVSLHKVEELVGYIEAVNSARMTLQENLDRESAVQLRIAREEDEDVNAA